MYIDDLLRKYIKKLEEQNEQMMKELNRKNKEIENIQSNFEIISNEFNKMSAMVQNLRDELVGDRMEQLDDYVIFLQTKYLEILGENEDECS